ncbi:MAG: UDP-N-acetylmuramate dehydrogenase [Desulfobacterales bacterium]|nr:UDP-N-acetylmuramate dehydrogenase [Desulfobacteraceae bacterium]MDD3990641.1 UDP-N-acetylmuramate dehydrogenase [Desulfobacteraceae bacterium]MDY0311530.1 UDP-N-acetylmuramate dehydrogenase [Desulfobacterales bacterium]
MDENSPMTVFGKQLAQRFGSALRWDEVLAPWTWMKVGGPAEFLVEVEHIEDLAAAHAICRGCRAPFTLLGDGSNVVIDDAGLAGLVVVNRVTHLNWDEKRRQVTAGAGFSLDRLVEAVSFRGWGDLTFAAGIPGTVGGALAGGAGAYGRLLAEMACRARVLSPDGTMDTLPVNTLGVGYRDSDILRCGQIVLEVTFGGFQADTAAGLMNRIAAIRADRAGKHPPSDLPCAGSYFKNLPPPSPGASRIAAGLLLDRCGAKSLRRGGAAVFHRHANIIVNTGGATAADILALADQMARLVRCRHGVQLEPEVRYLHNRS